MMIKRSRSVLRPLLLCSLALLAAPRAAWAHDERPPWLDAPAFDRGLHIMVQHPRVIRRPGVVDIEVTLRNMAGAQDVTVESVTYTRAADGVVETHDIGRRLATQRPAFALYEATVAEMHDLAHRADVDGVQRLARQRRDLLQRMAAAALNDHYYVPIDSVPAGGGSSIHVTVEITLIEGDSCRVIRRAIEIPIEPALPRRAEPGRQWRWDARTGLLLPCVGAGMSRDDPGRAVWFAGDQHLHTTYSLDALVLSGTEEDVTDYAATAELMGFDWIIITDHSNVHVTWEGTDYYTPEQFAAGSAQAAAYTAQNSLLALYGEEMGAGQTGLFALPSHYLAYPFAVDSTGYLENPSSGLIFGLAYCEPEQVIIDRVNAAGGFGFIAHPFDSGALAFAEWDFDSGAVGWSGLEIWSDTNGQVKSTDDEAVAKWYDLLNALPGPQQGQLGDRPGFPNTFPVGLGNSDAHEPGLIGATFTYAWMPEVSRENVTDALMEGYCVASNGPLLFGEINGARIGAVAFLLDGDNDLDLTLTTTAEFGPVGNYALSVYVNGVTGVTVPPTGDPSTSMTVRLEALNLGFPDKFVTLRADSTNGAFHAITNPIWLQFVSAGDADADGMISLADVAVFGECMAGPEIERAPPCDITDFDRDRDVDLIDFAGFQSAFTGS